MIEILNWQKLTTFYYLMSTDINVETGEKKRKNRVETSVDVLQRDRSEKVIKGLQGVMAGFRYSATP